MCEFTCGWIGGWILSGCILTAVDGVHACDRDVWVENVRMYCNRYCLFCVSGFITLVPSTLINLLAVC